MTLSALKVQVMRLDSIRGEVCVRAGRGAAATLLLDFGALRPPDDRGYREPERSLVSEAWWRLESASEVVVGSGDEYDVIEERVQGLVGQRAVATEVFLPSSMVRVNFDRGWVLWIFPDDSSSYVSSSEFPSAPWFLAGWAVPATWEI